MAEELATLTTQVLSRQALPMASTPHPLQIITLFVDKRVQARPAEPCLCLAHPGVNVLLATLLPRPGRGTAVSLLCLP